MKLIPAPPRSRHLLRVCGVWRKKKENPELYLRELKKCAHIYWTTWGRAGSDIGFLMQSSGLTTDQYRSACLPACLCRIYSREHAQAESEISFLLVLIVSLSRERGKKSLYIYIVFPCCLDCVCRRKSRMFLPE